jgi:hypothetical protein
VLRSSHVCFSILSLLVSGQELTQRGDSASAILIFFWGTALLPLLLLFPALSFICSESVSGLTLPIAHVVSYLCLSFFRAILYCFPPPFNSLPISLDVAIFSRGIVEFMPIQAPRPYEGP